MDLARKLGAEALGTALLLAVIIGSGIMADRFGDPSARPARRRTRHRPTVASVPAFVVAQLLGAVLALAIHRALSSPATGAAP